jgi:hypothetical protein
MGLAIGDTFDVRCAECAATLRYRVGGEPMRIFSGAETSPVSLELLDRRPGASVEGCPRGRDDCAAITAARSRLHDVPEYAERRQRP